MSTYEAKRPESKVLLLSSVAARLFVGGRYKGIACLQGIQRGLSLTSCRANWNFATSKLACDNSSNDKWLRLYTFSKFRRYFVMTITKYQVSYAHWNLLTTRLQMRLEIFLEKKAHPKRVGVYPINVTMSSRALDWINEGPAFLSISYNVFITLRAAETNCWAW